MNIITLMSFFSKLKFWKREEDEFDFEKAAEKEFSAAKEAPLEKSLFPEEKAPLTPTAFQQARGSERELELISSKLDTLKAMLASLEQRVAGIEQAIAAEKKQKLW